MDPDELEQVTNLAEVVSKVPHLALACIAAQQDTASSPGTGIKSLRLLNKSFRSTMSQCIRGCTFQLGLDVSTDHIHALIHFAPASQLSRLGLVILPLPLNPPTAEQALRLATFAQTLSRHITMAEPVFGDFGHRPSTADDAQHVAQQLDTVMAGLGPAALGNIRQLELDVQDIRSNNENCTTFDVTELADVFLPLASACHAVRHLRVAGSVGRAVISGLGVSCPDLRSLEVVCRDVPLVSLKQMHLLLPNIVNLKLLPSERQYSVASVPGRNLERTERVNQLYAKTLLEHCIECKLLTHLDAAWVEESDNRLTPALLHANMSMHMYSGFRHPRSSWKVWESLQTLVVHVDTEGLDLHQVGRIVAQAPQLTSLHYIGACVVTSHHAWEHNTPWDDTQSLTCLGERCQRGLKVTAASKDSTPRDLILALQAPYTAVEGQELVATSETSTLEFTLQHLSPIIITSFPGLCISHAIIGHSFHLIPRIFPDITSLTFDFCEILGEELSALKSLSSLSHLNFLNCNKLSTVEVMTVCLQLRALRVLTCAGCLGIHRTAAMTIKAALGHGVDVRHTDVQQQQVLTIMFPVQ